MKTWIAPLVVCSLTFSAEPATVAPVAETYEIDPIHSFALFKIKHLNLGYVWGRINGPTGTFQIDEADPSRSSVSIELQSENVDTHVAKRDQHLKSPDFFNAKEFPTITFKSRSVKKTGETFAIAGSFTLLGTSKDITVHLTRVGVGGDPSSGIRMGFDGTFTIKRSEFGMRTMLDTIGDDVQIHISFEGLRK